MELNEYQKRAMTTCMNSCDNFIYMFTNLIGEVGEFASKVAKGVRKGVAEIQDNNDFTWLGEISSKSAWDKSVRDNEYRDEELEKEAGDILWQLAGLCKVMGWSLEDVARMNLDKLASRKQRGVIDGDGDNR